MNPGNSETPLQSVADTAFWIAHFRALETERPDALFRDPLAARLAGERGKRIADAMPTSRIVDWTVAMRTCIIDEFIAEAIGKGADTVLNLGAGLDTRPYRMDLPQDLRWIEADYAHLIEYKEEKLQGEKPRCRLERVRIDLADLAQRREFLQRVDAESRDVLVLTEGVTPYLDNDAVGSLADDLRNQGRFRRWIVDYYSQKAMQIRHRQDIRRHMRNAPFKFAPGDAFEFFRRHGWKTAAIRYLADEAERARRPFPLPFVMRIALRLGSLFAPREKREAFRKFAGYLVLEPG